MTAFVATLPPDAKYAIEFRHESWFTDEVYDLLRSRDISMGIIEQEEFASPVVATATWGYARLHRFDYDTSRLAEWAGKIKALPWSEAFVYFKHDEGEGSGPPAVGAFMGAL